MSEHLQNEYLKLSSFLKSFNLIFINHPLNTKLDNTSSFSFKAKKTEE